jgi:hypothetical protein
MHTERNATSIMHARFEKALTIVLSYLGRVHGQFQIVAHHLTAHVKGTTGGKEAATEDPYLEAEKGVGTVLFPVRPSLDSNGCSGAVTCKALWTIVVALPQLVFRHVTLERLSSNIELTAGWT